MRAIIRVHIINDSVSEGEETIGLKLYSPDLSIIVVNKRAEIVIQDDDDGMPS